MSVLIVIPARMASTRFPGKPLALIAKMPMIERVWRIASAVKNASRVIIATDSAGLKAAAERFGAEVMMTSAGCRTGTDRVAEAVAALSEQYEIIFSLQGDAVLTPPWVMESVIAEMLLHPEVQVATPAVLLEGTARSAFLAEKAKGVSTGTTVVFDQNKNALYFSKSVIPFPRPERADYEVYRQIGLYAYRGESLKKLCMLPQGRLEMFESLEQLRALEHGIPMRVVIVDYRGRTHGSVDRPEDLPVIEEIIKREGELL